MHGEGYDGDVGDDGDVGVGDVNCTLNCSEF